MKKYTGYRFLLLFVFLAACDKEPEPERYANGQLVVCGVRDPLNNLKWLNDQFKLFQGGPLINGIVLYRYKGRNVIEVQNGYASSTNQHQYYCDGEKLNLDHPETFAQFKKDREEIAVLYGTNLWGR
ncbi:hypothetical protein [Larkinella humicola]|uniref:Uncharacterized protein n=1 Tax=Larkinella humicola TaxID=2607654 RepID=A0A5N1JIM2_9BACT|nr:hypothetical protein [Larkinella humicola]KAA9356285.1 hypothetical protein F0P93_00575 [Larkinella humicola]